jgi:hypothetical protein
MQRYQSDSSDIILLTLEYFLRNFGLMNEASYARFSLIWSVGF